MAKTTSIRLCAATAAATVALALSAATPEFWSTIVDEPEVNQRALFGDTIRALAGDHESLLNLNREAENRLYDTASPSYSEATYTTFLATLLESNLLDEYESIRPQYQLSGLMKNRPSTPATDFTYTDRDDTATSLYATDAELLLLVIFDPDCDHCTEVINNLADDDAINAAIADNRLTVLALYADGDEQRRIEVAATIPANWIAGFDTTGIQDNELYMIRDFPDIYLIDSAKTILLKNPSLPTLRSAITR